MPRRLHAAAVLLTAIALVPAGAHLAEMPAKLALSREGYMLVQGLYRGWYWFGLASLGAIAANLALGLALRARGQGGGAALAAAALLLAGLGIFFTWVWPANQATGNWLVLPPEDWEALRRDWEYAHAANAVLTFGALCLAVLSLPAVQWPEPEDE